MVPMREGLIWLVIGRYDQSTTGDDCVQWAVDALTDGHDSPALRKLAGLDAPVNGFEASRARDFASKAD